MKFFLNFVPFLLILINCATPKIAGGQSGISGQVFWVEGNLMPSIGDTTYQQRAAGIPVQRTVHIYEATPSNQAESIESGSIYSDVATQLITKIKTDENGYFRARLNPGKYSIFTQEENGLFANTFDDQSIINPVTVEAGKFTDIVIKVNYKAFY